MTYLSLALRSEQNEKYCAYDILKSNLLNEVFYILVKILKISIGSEQETDKCWPRFLMLYDISCGIVIVRDLILTISRNHNIVAYILYITNEFPTTRVPLGQIAAHLSSRVAWVYKGKSMLYGRS